MAEGSKVCILCVDQDPETLRFMRTHLETQGWGVLAAATGAEALQHAAVRRPDVILMDVDLPGLDGYEICRRLQEGRDTSYVPVVFVSPQGKSPDYMRALAVGGADFLSKPLAPATLIDKIREHLTTTQTWRRLQGSTRRHARGETASTGASSWDRGLGPTALPRFLKFLERRLPLSSEARQALSRSTVRRLYAVATEIGLPASRLASTLAEYLKLPFTSEVDFSRVRIGVLPTVFCRKNQIVAIHDAEARHAFVLSNPFEWEIVDALKKILERGETPKLFIAEPARLDGVFEPSGPLPAPGPEPAEPPRPTPAPAERSKDETEEKSAPVIDLVNRLIETAYEMRASDIHIEPREGEVTVRYRIDGTLRVVERLQPPELIRPIVARIKVMSGLKIEEKRLPQDGRVVFKEFSPKNLDFDLRISTAPLSQGEKVVMRILDKQKSVLPLPELGFSKRNLELYRSRITAPHGMILHVGPTGSGKSMTLYAALNEINSAEINVQTAEDPIEYTLPGVNQLQVHSDIELTFARALRAFLRQDPDIILVGEIRDIETAKTSIEAALTGHLLLSTLHTNDAASTIVRFVELGIEPYLVSSSIVLICAQRLLRRLCAQCKESYVPAPEERRLIGATGNGEISVFRPRGCERCNGIGYRGRIGTHEILAVNDVIRLAINKEGVTAEALKRLAVERGGMTTLWWDAMEKVRSGVTSVEEAVANVAPDEFDSRPEWMPRE